MERLVITHTDEEGYHVVFHDMTHEKLKEMIKWFLQDYVNNVSGGGTLVSEDVCPVCTSIKEKSW